jgi:hypothetical protein
VVVGGQQVAAFSGGTERTGLVHRATWYHRRLATRRAGRTPPDSQLPSTVLGPGGASGNPCGLSRARVHLIVIAIAGTIARCQAPDIARSGPERSGEGTNFYRRSTTPEPRATWHARRCYVSGVTCPTSSSRAAHTRHKRHIDRICNRTRPKSTQLLPGPLATPNTPSVLGANPGSPNDAAGTQIARGIPVSLDRGHRRVQRSPCHRNLLLNLIMISLI